MLGDCRMKNGQVINLNEALEGKKFDDLYDTVVEIEEATGKLIALSKTFDPKIRPGVLVKALVACIHDGLIDDQEMETIQGWLRSQQEKMNV